MTKMLIDRAAVEQALHVATAAGYPVALIATLRAALAEPQRRKTGKPKNATTRLGVVCFEAYARSYVGSNRWDIAAEAVRRAALAERDSDSPERRCGGPGCDMRCCQPVEEPVASAGLGPLPEPAQPAEPEGYMPGCLWPLPATPDYYTAEQMREYALRALAKPVQEPVQEPAHAARYLFLRDLALNFNALEAFVATQMLDHMRDAQKIDAAVDSAMATSPRRTAGAEGGPAAWGVDWGRDGDRVCVSITKMLPNGSVEIVDTQYEPPGWRQQKTD